MSKNLLICLMAGLALSPSVHAVDVVSTKNIGMELARDLSDHAVQACRKLGFQVSAVVVDRNGIVRSILRDDLATRFTIQIAREKANAAMMAGIPSGEFRKNRSDIRPEMNHVDGIIMMQGGIPISAGGARIGAIGVSGAPGGDKDEICAQKAIDAVKERLEFAE